MATGFVTKNLYEFRLETLNSQFFIFSIVRSLEESKLGNHKQSEEQGKKNETKTKNKNLENSSWKKAQTQKPDRSYLINLQ